MKRALGSLYVRLACLGALGSILSVGTLGGYIAHKQGQLAMQAARQEAYLLTTSVASALADDFIVKNYAGMDETVTQFFSSHATVQSLEVINVEGTVILASQRDPINHAMHLKHGGVQTPPAVNSIQFIIQNDHIETWAPVQGGKLIGWIKSDLALAQISAAQRGILIDTGLIALFAVTLSTLITLIALRQPIRHIRQAARLALNLPDQPDQALRLLAPATEVEQLVNALNLAGARIYQQNSELQLLNSLIESSDDPFYILDVDQGFRMIFANDAACRHYGMTREQLLRLRVPDWDADFDPYQLNLFWQELQRQKHLVFESRHRLASGAIVPVEVSANYVRYRERDLTVRHFQDISARKETEIRLRTLSVAVEQSPASIVMTDRHANLIYVNPFFTEVTGYTLEEVLGKNPRILKSGLIPPQIYWELWQTLLQGNVWHGELANRKKNGAIYWEEVHIAPVTDEHGTITHYVAVKFDISERKRIEEALLAHEAELSDAKNEAERAARAKSEFLANMSHEIRTPMNGIIGLTQLALNLPASPDLRDYLSKIESSSQALLGILNDILDYSKIEAGRMNVENIPFDLNQVVNTLHSLFGERAQAKQLDFEINVDADVPRDLIGDPLRLQQILFNLIGNAIKFTEHGRVALVIYPEQREKSLVCIHFSVSDTGIGLSQEDIGKLFQSFTQVDNSITRRFGGTGLGLAISHRLLSLMGGAFKVNSQPGQGTTFAFSLPFGIAATPLSSPPSAAEKTNSLADKLNAIGKVLAGTRILVAEDNAINQLVVKNFLKLAGIEADIAGNGQDALSKLEQGDFAAVLMDVHMPVMGGVEATQCLRAQPRFASLPIIALTAGVTPEERSTCLNAGMNDFVSKPIDAEQLVTTLLKWVPHALDATHVP